MSDKRIFCNEEDTAEITERKSEVQRPGLEATQLIKELRSTGGIDFTKFDDTLKESKSSPKKSPQEKKKSGIICRYSA